MKKRQNMPGRRHHAGASEGARTPPVGERSGSLSGSVAGLMPPLAREVLDERGTELAQRIGLDVIRQVVLDVLCGRNLRDSTEMLTRRRIATLNAATLVMLVRGAHRGRDFIRCLPDAVVDELKQRPRKHQRWILQWALGLTEKAAQNVLRDDFGALDEYKERYVAVLKDVISACERDFGPLVGEIRLSSQERAAVHWEFILHLLTTVGAQTLAIRGSEKSLYGKLFERLVLGSVLHALGFDLVPAPPNLPRLDRVFWLASPAEKRESDATALLGAGKGVRFDIGFIGRGNPEITLDKVTRYEREIDLGRRTWYLATFIIVDRIGARSGIQDLARRVDGTVVQMSMSYWPQELARQLRSKVGYAGELVDLEPTRLREYLAQKLALAPLQSFLEPPPAGRRRERAAPEGGDA